MGFYERMVAEREAYEASTAALKVAAVRKGPLPAGGPEAHGCHHPLEHDPLPGGGYIDLLPYCVQAQCAEETALEGRSRQGRRRPIFPRD